jgi:hypothetical protein
VFGTTGNAYGGTPMPLLYTLSRVMIRHTKSQTLGGAPVLSLPPKTEEKIEIVFTPEERKAYTTAHKAASDQFELYRAQGACGASHAFECTHAAPLLTRLLPLGFPFFSRPQR